MTLSELSLRFAPLDDLVRGSCSSEGRQPEENYEQPIHG